MRVAKNVKSSILAGRDTLISTPICQLHTHLRTTTQAKEKRQQAVAVCVLEVLHPRTGPQSNNGSAAPSQASGEKSKAAAPAPPKKRQRSMLDFASTSTAAAAATDAQQPANQHASATTHSTALKGMDRQYLMVQRAEGSGLLAGLWEFPGL